MIEVFKRINGCDSYHVSNYGRVIGTKGVLTLIKARNGYLYAHIKQDGKFKKRLVHRLVMETFKGKSSLTVNHKDFDRTNNIITNLEYATIGDNIRHSSRVGRYSRVSIQRKLSAEDVKIIRTSNETSVSLARYFNLSPSTITKIKRNLRYKDV